MLIAVTVPPWALHSSSAAQRARRSREDIWRLTPSRMMVLARGSNLISATLGTCLMQTTIFMAGLSMAYGGIIASRPLPPNKISVLAEPHAKETADVFGGGFDDVYPRVGVFSPADRDLTDFVATFLGQE